MQNQINTISPPNKLNQSNQTQDPSQTSNSNTETKENNDPAVNNSSDNESSDEMVNFVVLTFKILGWLIIPAFYLWFFGVLNNAINVTYSRAIIIMIVIIFISTFYSFLTISPNYVIVFYIGILIISTLSISSLFEINFIKSLIVLVISTIGSLVTDMLLIILLTAIFGTSWHSSMPAEISENKYYDSVLKFSIIQLQELKIIAKIDNNKQIASKKKKIDKVENIAFYNTQETNSSNIIKPNNDITTVIKTTSQSERRNYPDQNIKLKIVLQQNISIRNINKVREIIDNGFDINSNEPSFIIWQATNSWNTEIMKILLEKCNNINIKANNMITLLMKAASVGDLEITKLLIQKGANINDTDADGLTALHYLTSGNGNNEVLKYLIQCNADINAKSRSEKTPLMNAAANEFYYITQTLLENGAEINAQDKNGLTALMMAVQKYHNINVVKLLIEKGADPNLKDFRYAKTALEMASTSDIKKLLNAK